MHSIDQYVPITQAKSALLELVRRIKTNDSTVAITRKGVPEAVMISLDRFDGLLETIEILADEAAMKSIRKSISEAEKDEWVNAGGLLDDE